MSVVEYDSKIDSKNRITLRNVLSDYYHVVEESDGRIILEPKEFVASFQLSTNTLQMMDQSIDNIKKGKVSSAIVLSEFE